MSQQDQKITVGIEAKTKMDELTAAETVFNGLSGSIDNLSGSINKFMDLVKGMPQAAAAFQNFNQQTSQAEDKAASDDERREREKKEREDRRAIDQRELIEFVRNGSGSKRIAPDLSPEKLSRLPEGLRDYVLKRHQDKQANQAMDWVEHGGSGGSGGGSGGGGGGFDVRNLLKGGLAVGASLVGINASIGWITSSVQAFMQMDATITPLMRRIGDFDKMMRQLGATFGYSRLEFAALADHLNRQYFGNASLAPTIARMSTYTGISDQELARTGEMSRYGGKADKEFWGIAAELSLRQGTSSWKNGDFISGDMMGVVNAMTKLKEQSFHAGSNMSLKDLSRVYAIPAMMYGARSLRARPEEAMQILGSMQSGVTQSGNLGVEAFLRQAYGYGEGGMGYVEFQKAKTKGIFGDGNFDKISGRLRSMAGGNRTMLYQMLETLMPGLTPDQRDALTSAIGRGQTAEDVFKANPDIEAAVKEINKVASGEKDVSAHVPVGKRGNVALSELQYDVGKPFAENIEKFRILLQSEIVPFVKAGANAAVDIKNLILSGPDGKKDGKQVVLSDKQLEILQNVYQFME
jgi:hypothetical protein